MVFRTNSTTAKREKFHRQVLPKRFDKYKLTLHPEKTKLIDLKCETGKGDRSFDFLGFTHYIGKSRKGGLKLMLKTSSKKLTKAINQTEDWIKHNRHKRLKELTAELNAKLRGHYAYYGITFNTKGITSFYEQIRRRLQKWLNRRGGKHKWAWEKFNTLITEWYPLEKPRIYHSYLTAKPTL
jgi:RNA-directed DNA polymerase